MLCQLGYVWTLWVLSSFILYWIRDVCSAFRWAAESMLPTFTGGTTPILRVTILPAIFPSFYMIFNMSTVPRLYAQLKKLARKRGNTASQFIPMQYHQTTDIIVMCLCMSLILCRISIMSSRADGDGFLRVLQLLHTSRQPERGDRGDGQHNVSTRTRGRYSR